MIKPETLSIGRPERVGTIPIRRTASRLTLVVVLGTAGCLWPSSRRPIVQERYDYVEITTPTRVQTAVDTGLVLLPGEVYAKVRNYELSDTTLIPIQLFARRTVVPRASVEETRTSGSGPWDKVGFHEAVRGARERASKDAACRYKGSRDTLAQAGYAEYLTDRYVLDVFRAFGADPATYASVQSETEPRVRGYRGPAYDPCLDER